MKNEHYCRVCGFFIKDKPWGSDGKSPTYDICPCCGVEFGNEDYSIDSIRKYRTHWINAGTAWFDTNQKPDNWNLEEQLDNIPIEYY